MRRPITVVLMAILGVSMPAAPKDHPAWHLPTHIIVARGADAWSGRLRALHFLPTLGTVDAPAPTDLWEAGELLNAMSVDARQLWTFRNRDSVQHTPVSLQWEALSDAQQALINTEDELGPARIDYLRGIRRYEQGESAMRPRTGLLGAMRNARVQPLGPPDFVLDARHVNFRQQHARRPWMVYIGANDGMLHGFDALTGVERFAVIPDAVLALAARNASPGRPVPQPVCARPFAADAWTGTQWRSVLTCTNGAMAPGLFLVDVTDPTSYAPPPMLAYDGSDGEGIGEMEGPVPVVAVPNGDDSGPRWFAISGNGKGKSNANAASKLLLLALDQQRTAAWQPNRTAYAIKVPADASRGGLGAPAVAIGAQGTASVAYAADAQGQIWRFDLTGSPPWLNALGNNQTDRSLPLFTATSRSGSIQRILAPILLAATAGGPLLVFTAVDNEGNATLYGVADSGSRRLSRDSLAGLGVTDLAAGAIIEPNVQGSPNGWRIDLPGGQVPDDLITAGSHSLLLTTRDTKGRDRAYLLDALTGLPPREDGRTGHVLASAPLVTVQTQAPSTAPSTAPSGKPTQTTNTTLWHLEGGRIRQIETRSYTRQLGRLNWREMTETGAR
ncbi:pilus assembly protein [Ralstonia chuxiongensis]|uniref:pilus assembly protein n=1 Tax=Ralstonia chuxiongensis TaxID=2957504 RepID=UPI002931191B|nr:PilC/PilY family type IV pilus protein [Ralstonia chuxiongensis]